MSADAMAGRSTHSAARVAYLSPSALLLLMESDPTPHLLLDVRPHTSDNPLPFLIPESTEYRRASVLGKDETDLLAFLKAEFDGARDSKRDMRKTHLVVVLSIDGSVTQTEKAVEVLRWFGFEKVTVLEGGLSAFDPTIMSPTASTLSLDEEAQLKSTSLTPTLPPAPTYISRDALSVLLRDHKAAVLDVRRKDERDSFGMIDPTGGWIPVDELPNALAGSAALNELCGIELGSEKPLVIHCRTHRRAGFAAHLLSEHGIKSVVLKDGVWGWGFDEKVKAYPSYEEWDPLPEGKAGTETPDWSKGEAEVKELLG